MTIFITFVLLSQPLVGWYILFLPFLSVAICYQPTCNIVYLSILARRLPFDHWCHDSPGLRSSRA